ncbi:uroporphyrinogen-III synthase [Roseovarius albus]|uniref:Uroporphyrinogen-III synthase n=1 Tax=Roseovarius albus TaxID=1247867 RepID=A0A1X6ZVJ0_9RHOB|nr:uroporphyrinogen-III synthase [Roseovarius albus]SLN62928.1 uroporphyrinogen-III synthase [Roseovarius albus]
MLPTILIIRPEEAAIRFEQELIARFGADLRILRAPAMRMEFLSPQVKWVSINTLVFTSHVAVQAFAALTDDRAFACYAVGSTTATAARAIGLDPVDCKGDAAELVKVLLAARPQLPALYLRGEHVSEDIAAKLDQSGITVQSAIVYRQHAKRLTSEAKDLLQSANPVIVPLMSARSSRLLFDQANPAAQIYPVAISNKVAATVPEAYSAQLRTALKPNLQAVLDEVAKQIRDVKRLEGL